MDILVCYDVNTEDKQGKRRLRKVALECQNYGQRAQYSVFECSVSEVQFLELKTKLVKIIDKDKDSLRIYRLFGKRDSYLYSYGIDRYIDFNDPLVF